MKRILVLFALLAGLSAPAVAIPWDSGGSNSASSSGGGGGDSATVYPTAPLNARLTTESGVSVSTPGRTSQGTIYYTTGTIELYDGSAWTNYSHGELSLALTATSGKNYDVWVALSGGNPVLSLSAAWTDDTTRADAITNQDGAWVKATDKTKRLVGTIRASGSNVTEDSDRKRFVWNLYNKVDRPLLKQEFANNWTYASDTIRPTNDSTANRVEVVVGIQSSVIRLSTQFMFDEAGSNEDGYMAGIGVDKTDGNDCQIRLTNNPGPSGSSFRRMLASGTLLDIPSVGYHYYQMVEATQNGTQLSIYGDRNNSDSQWDLGLYASGLSGTMGN